MIAVGWRPVIDETACPACVRNRTDGCDYCDGYGVVELDTDGDITDDGELAAVYDTEAEVDA